MQHPSKPLTRPKLLENKNTTADIFFESNLKPIIKRSKL